MKIVILIAILVSSPAMADRLLDEEKLENLGKRWQAANKESVEFKGGPGTPEQVLKDYNKEYALLRNEDVLAAEYKYEVAKFLMTYGYIPSIPRRQDFISYDQDGKEAYDGLPSRLSLTRVFCNRAVLVDEDVEYDSRFKCPAKYKNWETRNRRFAKELEKWITERSQLEETSAGTSLNAITEIPVDDLGRGYKRRISGAGVLTIERAYPNKKNPKMILIGYEGMDKLEKGTAVPLIFVQGDESKSLEFQVGSEIPEDEVTKGRRILTLQIIRFKKRAKEKPDSLTNKELAAIEDFIKQFNGREISDSDNILLTEIYPDPDSSKQQVAVTWRMPFDSTKSPVELGYQAVQGTGAAK